MDLTTSNQLEKLIAPLASSCQLELWGVEVFSGRRGGQLRIFIDKQEGIEITDCENISRLITPLLEVKAPRFSDMDLEVSSPGLDRKFFNLEQCESYTGQTLAVQLQPWVDGFRSLASQESTEATDQSAEAALKLSVKKELNMKAVLQAISLTDATFTLAGYQPVAWEQVKSARLIPSFEVNTRK